MPSRVAPRRGEAPAVTACGRMALRDLGAGPGDLQVEVAEARCRTNRRGLAYHVRGRGLPRGSYRRLSAADDLIFGDVVYIAGPEAVFLQMASVLPFLELVALGCELTAGYALQPEVEGGLVRRRPLCSARSIERYLARCSGIAGVKPARRALRLLAEGALSPPEAKVALLAGLPTSLGGYGRGIPLLNCDCGGKSRLAELVGDDGRGRRLGAYVCDLLWPEHGVALEYQGRQAHEGRLVRDAVRQVRLGAAGVDVIPITHEQVDDAILFHEVMMALMGKSGVRWRCTVPDFGRRRWELRRALRCLSTGSYRLS